MFVIRVRQRLFMCRGVSGESLNQAHRMYVFGPASLHAVNLEHLASQWELSRHWGVIIKDIS